MCGVFTRNVEKLFTVLITASQDNYDHLDNNNRTVGEGNGARGTVLPLAPFVAWVP